jgi:hypothetical protein
MTDEFQSPSFKIYDSATPRQRELLTSLEENINASPELYSAALDAWIAAKERGAEGIAIVKAIEYLRQDDGGNASSEDFGRAYDQWGEYMQSLADRAFEFDEVTEVASISDTGILAAKANEDLTPEEKRDRIRYERMRFFTGLVALKGANSANSRSDERKTG